MKTGSFKWIIFDAVGTLIYPTPPVAEVYWTIGRTHGSRFGLDEVRLRFQTEFRRSFESQASTSFESSETMERERWRQIVDRVFEDVNDRDSCFEELYDHFAKSTAWALFQDVPLVLGSLHRAGYRLAIGSNFDARLHEVCAGWDALRWMDQVYASAELGYRKPSFEFYRELGARLSATPGELLMVGDHLENDVRGARQAGLSARLIDRDDRHSEEQTRLRSLSDLLTEFSIAPVF